MRLSLISKIRHFIIEQSHISVKMSEKFELNTCYLKSSYRIPREASIQKNKMSSLRELCAISFFFFKKNFLLTNICFTALCQFLLYSKVISCMYTFILTFRDFLPIQVTTKTVPYQHIIPLNKTDIGKMLTNLFAISMEPYTLPYVKQIASGNLLYDLGSSNLVLFAVQRGGMRQDVGERFLRERTYVYLC